MFFRILIVFNVVGLKGILKNIIRYIVNSLFGLRQPKGKLKTIQQSACIAV